MGNSSDDRVALVTGAAQRIGAAIARELHRAGCRVLVHYRSSAAGAEQLVRELNALRPDSCAAVQADLCRPDEVRALANAACWMLSERGGWLTATFVSTFPFKYSVQSAPS